MVDKLCVDSCKLIEIIWLKVDVAAAIDNIIFYYIYIYIIKTRESFCPRQKLSSFDLCGHWKGHWSFHIIFEIQGRYSNN